jgi:hypothetical protein
MGAGCEHTGSIGVAIRTSESYTTMRITFARLIAAIVLAVGGALTALTAFGLGIADVVVGSGRFAVLPAGARMLHDMAATAPVVGALGVVAFVTALILVVDARRARAIGLVVSVAGTAIGLGLVALVIAATGPFASMPSDRVVDGLGIVGSYAAFHLVALVALAVDRPAKSAPPVTAPSAA